VSSPSGPDRPAVLTGWGRTAASVSRVITPAGGADAVLAMEAPQTRGVIPRGLGRSYGDAAQNAGGTVISTAGLNRIIDLDRERGVARVEAGVSLDQLMRASVPWGWWPAVTPGTRSITVGGAVASDVHGKNHHRDGTFSAHVENLVLATPGRGVITAGPDREPDAFWATVGGMGLTGLILEATLKLVPIRSTCMRVDIEKVRDLDTLMARMAWADGDRRYTVAWIDPEARGRQLGRAVLETADHDDASSSGLSPAGLRFSSRGLASVPRWMPGGMINRLTVPAFNRLWYQRKPGRADGEPTPLAAFFHPLDRVQNWNRVYGKRGFVQYQFVVPDSRSEVVGRALVSLAAGGIATALAVLKRFGPANPAPLSFPMAGWSLAVDIPVGSAGGRREALAVRLDHLDEVVAAAGGRVYLTKDSRLRPDLLDVMYPRLGEWRGVRDGLDPEGFLNSDLSRRLGLTVQPPRS
jgi:decaprenylphospho-beta-D-ribofuranose 2-oxidase